MRNARQNKIREYRKAIRGAKGTICLWKLFDKLHPNFFPKGRRWWFGGTVWWHAYRKAQREWMRNLTQEPVGQFHGMGNASASFRRDLNRLHRAKEKQALRRAVARDELEDFANPRPRRNANWLYW